jgi:hypothetical protein
MLKTQPRMKLSREEEAYLRHWMFDEVHYQEGQGEAKQLQLRHGATPAELAILIAASLPDPADQEAAAHGPSPVEPPLWPWSDAGYRSRLAEARVILGERQGTPRTNGTS